MFSWSKALARQLTPQAKARQGLRFFSHQPPESKTELHPLPAAHFRRLLRNRFNRFAAQSQTIAHAVCSWEQGQMVARQFQLPQTPTPPHWSPLNDIRTIVKGNTVGLAAETLEKQVVYANRHFRFWDSRRSQWFAFFPFSLPSHMKKPFWGSAQLSTIKGSVRLQTPPESTIGGKAIVIDAESVRQCQLNPQRKPSQNQVMGTSAITAFEQFYEQWSPVLSNEMRWIVLRAISCREPNRYAWLFRPEWLHAYAHGLAAAKMQTQHPLNLGGAGKWVNTMMMILEGIAKWYAQHYPKARITLKPTFNMLFGTKIISNIDLEVQVWFPPNHTLIFTQQIEALRQKHPVMPQASDLAQFVGIAQAFLHNEQPLSQAIVDTTALDVYRTARASHIGFYKSPLMSGEEKAIPPSASRARSHLIV